MKIITSQDLESITLKDFWKNICDLFTENNKLNMNSLYETFAEEIKDSCWFDTYKFIAYTQSYFIKDANNTKPINEAIGTLVKLLNIFISLDKKNKEDEEHKNNKDKWFSIPVIQASQICSQQYLIDHGHKPENKWFFFNVEKLDSFKYFCFEDGSVNYYRDLDEPISFIQIVPKYLEQFNNHQEKKFMDIIFGSIYEKTRALIDETLDFLEHYQTEIINKEDLKANYEILSNISPEIICNLEQPHKYQELLCNLENMINNQYSCESVDPLKITKEKII